MIEWLDDFYGSDDMRDTLLQSFLPVFSAYAAEISPNPSKAFVASLVASFIDRYLGSSRAQLQEVVKDSDDPAAALAARITEWEDKRPAKVAVNETVRTANAIAIEQMRSEGVVTKRWATSGSDSCPYCTSLDGTAVEIERAFFTPADSFQPEGADTPMTFSTDVGHPPVHAGCVCSVVPG